jgi:hypothetical protein
VTGQRPVAISDEAMAVLFDLARPLAPGDRTLFVEDVHGLPKGVAMASSGCGPIAVSLITGKPVEDICKALADAGHDGIKTTECDRGPVFSSFGYRMEPIECWCDGEPALSGPTVLAWLRRRSPGIYASPLLLLAEIRARRGAHWIAVRGDEFGDTWLTGCRCQSGLSRLACWRLHGAFTVTPVPPARPISAESHRAWRELVDSDWG